MSGPLNTVVWIRRGSLDETLLHRPTEHFAVDGDDHEAGGVGCDADPALRDDERWWREVEQAIEADDVGIVAFDHTPKITDLLEPPSACACGRLPHLCTCEYHRLQLLRLGCEQLDTSLGERGRGRGCGITTVSHCAVVY